jgi:DNA-binding transcriptional LysR family regulator
MLDLNQVFLFCEVVKAGSFAQAAQRLRLPANSVSRKIQQLETDLGSRLIHRSTRKLTLTTAGQAFFERCASPVSELAQAGQESMDDAKTDLIAASIDVAFRAAHLVEARHIGHKLTSTHFGLVASPIYVSARGTPSHPQALSNHDCIPQSNLSGPVTWHLQGPDGPTSIEVSGRFRASAARVVLRAALAGLGIALLPDLVTTSEIEAGRLVRVLPKYRREGADLYAVYVSRRQVPLAVSAFAEFAGEKIRTTL